MPLTLEATAGLATSNCYCTLEEAKAFMDATVWKEDWVGKTDEELKAAIINAARMMDDGIRWVGVRSSQDQAMAWPRSGNIFGSSRSQNVNTYSPDYLVDRDGYIVATDSIPAKIKRANAGFALRLLGDDRAADSGGLSPETLKVGPIDLGPMHRQPIPSSVLEMVREFVAGGGQPQMVRG